MVFLYMAPGWRVQPATGARDPVGCDCRRRTWRALALDPFNCARICESFSFTVALRRAITHSIEARPDDAMPNLPNPPDIHEVHELPCVEAMLAATLALMTGHSQNLQAALDPEHRLKLGLKIGENLALLVDHPLLSAGFRQVLLGLQRRWHDISDCTAQAAPDCGQPKPPSALRTSAPMPSFVIAAPKRLQ
jgi:hypothetical protein